MIEWRVGIEEIDPTTGRAAFGVGHREHHSVGAAMDDGTCAHRARFFGDIERAVGESPGAQRVLSGGECEHFRVSGGVLQGFDLVGRACNDFALVSDDGADGYFIGLERFACFSHRLAHEILITLKVDNRLKGIHEDRVIGENKGNCTQKLSVSGGSMVRNGG